jgi:hypothetical protein
MICINNYTRLLKMTRIMLLMKYRRLFIKYCKNDKKVIRFTYRNNIINESFVVLLM